MQKVNAYQLQKCIDEDHRLSLTSAIASDETRIVFIDLFFLHIHASVLLLSLRVFLLLAL